MQAEGPEGGQAAAAGYARYTQGDAVGAYTVVGRAGAGRYGVVLRATRAGDGVEVAIKAPRHFKSAVTSIEDEVRLLQTLGASEHIVALVDDALVDAHGRCLAVLEWVDGGSVYDVLRTHRHADTHLPTPTLRRFTAQLLDGLAWIHDRGYSHADIKPDNLLVDAALARVKYCDLGHAERVDDDKGTVAQVPIVTTEYRSPEVLFERPPYTTAIDVWSLACTIFELAARYPLIDLSFEEDSDDDATSETEATEDEWVTDDEESGSGDDDKGSKKQDGSSSSSDDDEWEQDLLHLARFRALFGDKFVPKRVRQAERRWYNKKGELRGGKSFKLDSEPVLERLRDESGLDKADAKALDNLLSGAFHYQPAQRATCAAMRAHVWLRDV